MADETEEQRAARSEMAGSRDAQKALGRKEIKAKIPTMRYPKREKGRKPTRG
jgi:hypothetical protein